MYEALQNTVYILLPPHCKNYCTTFCICWTPTLQLKITATGPDLRWCRLLVLDLLFSQRKFGICPEKVGKMAFFGCIEFQCNKFTCILLLSLKMYWSKVQMFWSAVVVGFLMVGLQKLCCIKKMVLVGTLLKSCKCSLIFRKTVFFNVSLFTLKCLMWQILD